MLKKQKVSQILINHKKISKISSLLPANYSDPNVQPFTRTGVLNSTHVPPPYSNNFDGNIGDSMKKCEQPRQKIRQPYNTAV